MRGLEEIAQEVMRGGRPGDTPAAAIEWGTWTRQRTVIAPLARLSSAVRSEGLDSPAVVVVGEMVRDTGGAVVVRRAGPRGGGRFHDALPGPGI